MDIVIKLGKRDRGGGVSIYVDVKRKGLFYEAVDVHGCPRRGKVKWTKKPEKIELKEVC